MNVGKITVADCVNVAPPPDPRCDDEAFRINNPGACPVHPALIIKPSVALACVLGSLQFKAFYTVDGVEEDVTGLAVWVSADDNVAIIGSISGNATGLSMGTVAISATYLGITALAELTVLGGDCCDDRSVGMMLVVDTSRSMSQSFSGAYSTRLAFAKSTATLFASEVNEGKDKIGLMKFNTVDSSVLSSLTSDKASVMGMIPGITQTQQKTSFYDALSVAIAELDTAAPDLKVIALISDGLDTVNTTYTEDNNPITLLSNFRSQGGIVICLGVRASGKGFQFLSALATGGFFINAFPGNSQAALDYFSGIKGYICAGNCTPAGDVIVGQGQLSYDAFINWNVTDGTVDLQGNGFFDFLPGNGLYVGLGGTDPAVNGKLTIKTPLALVANHIYSLAVRMAGNHQLDIGPQSALVKVYYVDDNGDELGLASQRVTINSHTQDFQLFSIGFTALQSGNAYISIQQDTPVGDNSGVGLLLDQVTLKDTTDIITLFDDDFDDENPVYVPPRCGAGTIYTYLPNLGAYGYAYGNDCGGGVGCLTTPPIAQLPDPNPLSDIESGFQPPKTYSSTQTVCVSCEPGFTNTAGDQSICKTASATSETSQSAADATARNAATALAQAELVCERLYTSTQTYTAVCDPTVGTGPSVTRSSTKTSLISQEDADALALADAIALAEADLDCTQSNSDQTITINDRTLTGSFRKASPYPSIHFELSTAIVSNVTLRLIEFSHDHPSDVRVLLVGPNGATCELMASAGNNDPGSSAVTDLDLIFDDAAGSQLPALAPLTSGTWKPSVYASNDYPAPAPAGPYGTSLAIFNGISRHGGWTLYIVDALHNDLAGRISAWSLIIT